MSHTGDRQGASSHDIDVPYDLEYCLWELVDNVLVLFDTVLSCVLVSCILQSGSPHLLSDFRSLFIPFF
jgi:hypothetical protein